MKTTPLIIPLKVGICFLAAIIMLGAGRVSFGQVEWQQTGQFDVGRILEDSRIEGVAFDGENFFLCGAGGNNGEDPNTIYVINQDGEQIRDFVQPGESRYGMKDLEWDGELLWGSGETRIFGFDTDGNIVHEFQGPFNPVTYCVAYDSDRNVLWVSSTTTPIVNLSREGELIGDTLDRKGLRLYGLGYWAEDPDGYQLYALTSYSEAASQVYKFNLENGDTLFVQELDPRPGGVYLTQSWIENQSTFMATFNRSDQEGGDLFKLFSIPNQRIEQLQMLIPLHYGWNMISSVNQTRLAEMPDVWADIIGRRNLIIAKDYSGHYLLPGIFNNMEPWDVRQAYWVKMDWRDTLTIVNIPVATETPIALRQGWNMIAYFPEQDLDIRDALAGIVDEVVLVKDSNGRFYRPFSDFSNMPPLTRGRGYQVAVSEACELVYPDGEFQMRNGEIGMRNGKVSADDGASAEEVTHFQPVARTGANMSVLLNGKWKRENGTGEIGVFTANGLCVGASSLSTFNSQLPIGIAIWADDPTTPEIDGAVEGEALSFRIWDGDNVTLTSCRHVSPPSRRQVEGAGETPVEHAAKMATLCFQTDGFAEVTLDVGAFRETPLPSEFTLYDAFPNPFNATTLIGYDLPSVSAVTLTVTDLAGREVARLSQGNYMAGSHSVVWDALNQPSGIYLVKLETPLGVKTSKIALIR